MFYFYGSDIKEDFSLEGTYISCHTLKDSEKIQKYAFSLGYKWLNCSHQDLSKSLKLIFKRGKQMLVFRGELHDRYSSYKELDLSEIFEDYYKGNFQEEHLQSGKTFAALNEEGELRFLFKGHGDNSCVLSVNSKTFHKHKFELNEKHTYRVASVKETEWLHDCRDADCFVPNEEKSMEYIKYYDTKEDTIYHGAHIGRDDKLYEYIFRGGRFTEERYILIHDKRLSNSSASGSSTVKKAKIREATKLESAWLRASLKARGLVDVSSLEYMSTIKQSDLEEGEYYKFETANGTYVITKYGKKGLISYIQGGTEMYLKESFNNDERYFHKISLATTEEQAHLNKCKDAGKLVEKTPGVVLGHTHDHGGQIWVGGELGAAAQKAINNYNNQGVVFQQSHGDPKFTHISSDTSSGGNSSIEIGHENSIIGTTLVGNSIAFGSDQEIATDNENKSGFKEIPFGNPKVANKNKPVEKVSIEIEKVKTIKF